MILGVFGPDRSAYFIANIKVPRLMVEGTFPLLVDTGADGTTLHVREAILLLSAGAITNPEMSDQKTWAKIRKTFRVLRNPTPVGGVGGTAIYFKEPVQITFTHQDGTEEQHDFDIDIAKPARFGGRKFDEQFELPSLLGVNILDRFRLVIDWLDNEIFLDHN